MTFQKLYRDKFDLAFTTINPDRTGQFSVFVKPRHQKEGYDKTLIDDKYDLRYVTSKFSNMIFQKYVPDTENMVHVLSYPDRKPLVEVPRIRLEAIGGISTGAVAISAIFL
jgi:hypothetical protein